MSSQITFAQVSADEARMYQDGEHVGDVYRQPDILMDGAVFYLVAPVRGSAWPRCARA